MKTKRTRRISSRERARQISAELDYAKRHLLEGQTGLRAQSRGRPRRAARDW